VSAVRPDPAPSKLAYRMQRWWLTPVVRATIRVGVPAFVLAFSAGFYLSDPKTIEAISLEVMEIRRSVEERPEFMVHAMRLDGASEELSDDVAEVMGVDFPVSSFDLDLQELVVAVAGLDAVAEVNMTIRPGGILEVALSEREAALVWQSMDALEALDRDGHRVGPMKARQNRMDLPLIVGAGADQAAAEALELIRTARPIAEKVGGLVRVGERRWDVVVIDGPRILLPENDAVDALNRVLAAHSARELLDRDLVHIDMRNPQRPTLRLTQSAQDRVVAQRTMLLEQLQENIGAGDG